MDPPLSHRNKTLRQLSHQGYVGHEDPYYWHGRMLTKKNEAPLPHFWHGRMLTKKNEAPLPLPVVTWQSSRKPRDDHDDVPTWLTASEYQDVDEVMNKKIDALALLLELSTKTVVYSGAGISRAAGIGQAARGRVGGHNKSTTAQPTITHHALTAMYKAGQIHSWVQQNHDGLPQKAGFPQERVNEVHGSWYDPSNPVVKYSGKLKGEEYAWMVEEAETADLVLVLGTSLGGLNADQVPLKAAARSLRNESLGMVLINLQQTVHDGKSTLRLFGESDVILTRLMRKMAIEYSPTAPVFPRRVLVPYNAQGRRSSSSKQMWLDLNPGSKVKLTKGHNAAGAGQPAYNHMSRMKQPEGKVTRWNSSTMGIELCMEGTSMLLGQWWIEAAQRGGPAVLPIVNSKPEFVE